jgi:DNA (cytosine-5)-methyltransferase 1
MMTHGDLFSGIGGFALAARWMGWRTAWFSEIDPFACRVLAHHWPDVPQLGDVTRVDWSTAWRILAPREGR